MHQQELERHGLYGLLPLILAAIGLWMSPWALPTAIAFDLHQLALAYAGAVAAFLAGVGAGAALGLKAPQSVAPSLWTVAVVWIAIAQAVFLKLLPGVGWRYLLLVAIFVYLLLRDLEFTASGLLPRWYGALRARLTAWVCGLLLAIALRLFLLGYG